MAKFLIEANYTADGIKGLQVEGATARVRLAHMIAESLGGKCDGFYWCFGDRDVVALFDLPDAVSITALAMAVSASGSVRAKTTPLLAASDMDEALKKSVAFKSPGR